MQLTAPINAYCSTPTTSEHGRWKFCNSSLLSVNNNHGLELNFSWEDQILMKNNHCSSSLKTSMSRGFTIIFMILYWGLQINCLQLPEPLLKMMKKASHSFQELKMQQDHDGVETISWCSKAFSFSCSIRRS